MVTSPPLVPTVHYTAASSPPPPRFALAVWATSGYEARYATVIARNRAWATARGYGFVLDRNNYDAALAPPRARHWGKVLALRAALLRFENVLLLDADCAVVNATVRLEWYADELPRLDHSQGPYDVVLTNYDDSAARQALWVNSAVMLVRRTPWTFAWLDAWWAQGAKARWFAHDQGGLWNALLELGIPDRGYGDECARGVVALEPHLLRECVTAALGGRAAGAALGALAGHVRLLRASAPPGSVEAAHPWARGLHFWSSMEIALHRWVSFTQPFEQLYYRGGDFIVQSRNPDEWRCAACIGSVRQARWRGEPNDARWPLRSASDVVLDVGPFTLALKVKGGEEGAGEAVAQALCRDERVGVEGERHCSAQKKQRLLAALGHLTAGAPQAQRIDFGKGAASDAHQDQPTAHVAGNENGEDENAHVSSSSNDDSRLALDQLTATATPRCDLTPMATSFCRHRGLLPPPRSMMEQGPLTGLLGDAAPPACPARALVVLHFVINGADIWINVPESMDTCGGDAGRRARCKLWLRSACESNPTARPQCTLENVEEMVAQVYASQSAHWRKPEISHHARWLLPLCS